MQNQILAKLIAARRGLNRAIAIARAADARETVDKCSWPVRLDRNIGNALINQAMLVLSSDYVPRGLIEPEKQVTVVMPQTGQRFQSCWSAQYRLRARSELHSLLDHVTCKTNDLTTLSAKKIHIEINQKHEWNIAIR